MKDYKPKDFKPFEVNQTMNTVAMVFMSCIILYCVVGS